MTDVTKLFAEHVLSSKSKKPAYRHFPNDGQKYYLILNVNYGNGEPEEIKTEVTYLDKKPEVIAQIIEKLKL